MKNKSGASKKFSPPFIVKYMDSYVAIEVMKERLGAREARYQENIRGY